MPWRTPPPVPFKPKPGRRASDGPRQDQTGAVAVVVDLEEAVAAVFLVAVAVVVALKIGIRFRSGPFRCFME